MGDEEKGWTLLIVSFLSCQEVDGSANWPARTAEKPWLKTILQKKKIIIIIILQ
jgi:hypothetical protein